MPELPGQERAADASTGRAVAALLRARSVAVVGASARPESFAARSVENLQRFGFRGDIYPVNPGRATLAGLTCYPSVLDIPGDVELAVVVVPAAQVNEVLEECVRKEVTVAVVVSAGFGEGSGDDAGRARGEQLRALLDTSDLRVLGPNCIGPISLRDNMVPRAALYFGEGMAELAAEQADRASIALVSQSGGASLTIINRALARGRSFAYVVPTGSEFDLDLCDLVEHALDDPDITVICIYVESLADGPRFARLAARARREGKPIVAMRVGHSRIARDAIAAHIGALVSGDVPFEALCRSTGIVRVADTDAVHETAELLRVVGTRRIERLGVISLSGGEASFIADLCERAGIELPDPGAETLSRLRGTFSFGAVRNPLDPTGEVFGSHELLARAVEAFTREEAFDAVLVVVPYLGDAQADWLVPLIADAARASDRPVLAVWWSGDRQSEAARRRLSEAGVPAFDATHRCIEALGRIATYLHDDVDTEPTQPAGSRSPGRRQGVMGEVAAMGILEEYGVPGPARRVASSPEAAVDAAAEIGYPVVMKITGPEVAHKSEVGGVRLGLDRPERVAQAYAELAASSGDVLVAAQVDARVEVILGCKRDFELGLPIVALGAGGVLAELFPDRAVRVAPVSARQAEAMIDEAGLRPLIDGYRGGPPADGQALVEAIVAFGRMAVAEPDFHELEINPLAVREAGAGVVALDALAIAAAANGGPGP